MVGEVEGVWYDLSAGRVLGQGDVKELIKKPEVQKRTIQEDDDDDVFETIQDEAEEAKEEKDEEDGAAANKKTIEDAEDEEQVRVCEEPKRRVEEAGVLEIDVHGRYFRA